MVYDLEEIIPIEYEIPSLKLAIELLHATSTKEERLLHLTHLDETQCDVAMANEPHKKHIKVKYDKNFKPCVFSEGDIILLYDQDFEKLGLGSLSQCG